MTTERVYVRHVTRRDRSEFLELMRLSQELHQPWISPPLTNLSFHNYMQRCDRVDHIGLLVCERESKCIAGAINVNNIVRGSFLSASLGYYAGAPYAGRGYMREGLELVKRYAFLELGLHRLEANIQPDNHRSIGMVKHCGFECEGLSRDFLYIAGRWCDHERWAILHDRRTLTT